MPTGGSKGLVGKVPEQLSHILSGAKALWVAHPYLLSCADASVYETAINLVR